MALVAQLRQQNAALSSENSALKQAVQEANAREAARQHSRQQIGGIDELLAGMTSFQHPRQVCQHSLFTTPGKNSDLLCMLAL